MRMVERIGYSEGINQTKSFTQIEVLSDTQMLDVVARALKDIHSAISEAAGSAAAMCWRRRPVRST